MKKTIILYFEKIYKKEEGYIDCKITGEVNPQDWYKKMKERNLTEAILRQSDEDGEYMIKAKIYEFNEIDSNFINFINDEYLKNGFKSYELNSFIIVE